MYGYPHEDIPRREASQLARLLQHPPHHAWPLLAVPPERDFGGVQVRSELPEMAMYSKHRSTRNCDVPEIPIYPGCLASRDGSLASSSAPRTTLGPFFQCRLIVSGFGYHIPGIVAGIKIGFWVAKGVRWTCRGGFLRFVFLVPSSGVRDQHFGYHFGNIKIGFRAAKGVGRTWWRTSRRGCQRAMGDPPRSAALPPVEFVKIFVKNAVRNPFATNFAKGFTV